MSPNRPGRGEKPKAPSLGASHTDLGDYDSSASQFQLIARRRQHLGGSLLFYHDPVHLVRGEGVYLFDDAGNRFLDCYNNVPSVGHCNPRVTSALCDQAKRLNTHTRYLHESVIDYAEQLAATLPDPLEVCFFTCTGTEANELAMRLARTATQQRGAVVMEYSYHGNSTLIAELSTAGTAPDRRPSHVVAVEPPNTYRGPFRLEEREAGKKYASLVRDATETLKGRNEGIVAFLCDAIFDSQGGLEAPGDYFEHAYQAVRAAGGLCIADEVQAGFARTGTMWGFEHYGVVPDIVTFGKPAGNGHPVAGVVTTRSIAERFADSGFYFNTFGGNPVSAVVGQAVLDEIAEKELVAHAAEVGRHLRSHLETLGQQHELVGNVRGRGLYQAIELVSDPESLEPAAEQARRIPDAMKDRGVLLGLSGRFGNVLKIRPPLVFAKEDADHLANILEEVLREVV